ncbi:hypothetical protein LJC59_07490 [Desulfovibrio sp. OttesenSCG-928-A18]|nr:hypothetical protein [Desulfovibrio sp. OttesenSCG-928-A18]
MAFFSSPVLLFILISIASSFAFIALNVRFYTKRQMMLSLLISALVGCLGGALATWLHGVIAVQAEATSWFVGHGATLADGVISLLAAFWFYLFSERFFSETIANVKHRRIALAILFLAASLVGALFSLLPLVVMLSLHIVLSCFDLKKNAAQTKELLFHDNKTYYTQRIKRNLLLEKKPNIYCLFLESYHSREALKELYNFDDSPTDELLKEYGFTDYGSAFSNYPWTSYSLKSLLTGQMDSVSQAFSAFAFDILRENGYNIEFYDESAYVCRPYVAKEDFFIFRIPDRILWLYTVFGPFLSQSRYIRRVLAQDFDPFVTSVSFDAVYAALKQRLSSADDAPKMRWLRFGAAHIETAPLWQPDHSEFATEYLPLVEQVRHDLRKILALITQKDPQAIVIIQGDHGTLTHWNAWIGHGEANEVLQQRGVSIRHLALSLFGIRLAIRWPSPEHPAPKCMMPINVFRYIFSYLGGSGETKYYTQLAPNISLTQDGFCVVQDGKPLEKIFKFNMDILGPDLLCRAEDDLATVDEFILLGRKMHDLPMRIKVLQKGISLFPKISILQAYLGEAMCQSGDEKGLAYLKSCLDKFPKDKTISSLYGLQLAQYAHHAEALQYLPFPHRKNADLSRAELIAILSSLIFLGRQEEALSFCFDHLKKAKMDHLTDPIIGIFFLESSKVDAAYEAMVTRDNGTTLNVIYKAIASMALLQCRKYKEAESLLVKHLSKRNSAWAFRLLSHVREKLGDVPGAMKALLEGIESRSDSHMLFLPLGLLLTRYSIDGPQFSRVKEIAQTQLETFMTLCTRSQAFDVPWYRKTWLQNTSFTSPFHHYLSEGIYTGAQPSPWFSPFFYLLLHQDLWDVGVDPLIHFIAHGATELRRPSFVCSPAAVIKGRTGLIQNPMLLIRTINKEWSINNR